MVSKRAAKRINLIVPEDLYFQLCTYKASFEAETWEQFAEKVVNFFNSLMRLSGALKSGKLTPEEFAKKMHNLEPKNQFDS